jgi:hypothetical protein
MDVRQFFSPSLLLGIIYIARLNGVPKYAGQELQTVRRRQTNLHKFNTAAKLLNHRREKHFRDAHAKDKSGNSKPLCPAFGRAILKYGEEAFVFDVLHVFHASTEEDLRRQADELERESISQYNTIAPNGYNLTSGGQSGYVYTNEAREAISRGIKASFTDARRQEISDRMSKLTPAQEDDVVAEYSKGVSASDLAKKYSVTLTTITSRLKGRDVSIVWGKGGHYASGENHPQAKVDAEIALAIYACKSSVNGAGRATAREFGVSPQLVSRIWTGQRWGSVTGASTRSK